MFNENFRLTQSKAFIIVWLRRYLSIYYMYLTLMCFWKWYVLNYSNFVLAVRYSLTGHYINCKCLPKAQSSIKTSNDNVASKIRNKLSRSKYKNHYERNTNLCLALKITFLQQRKIIFFCVFCVTFRDLS